MPIMFWQHSRSTGVAPVRYFPCCTIQTSALSAAIFSLVYSALCIIYLALQLDQIGTFVSNHSYQQQRTDGAVATYYDKHGREVTVQEMVYLLNMAQTEKAVAAAALNVDIFLAITAGVLIKGVMDSKPALCYAWMGFVTASLIIGTTYIILDICIYGFHPNANIALITWLIFTVVLFHAFRAVIYFIRQIRANTQMNREGVAVFDVSNTNPNVFNISGNIPGTSSERNSVVMSPPPYEEAITQPDCTMLPDFSKPPAYPEDKPPDYTP